MTCDGCGANARRTRYYAETKTEVCDQCQGIGSIRLDDVYFQGAYFDPHLIDLKNKEQQKAKGVWIESRRQKADIMRRLGVVEAGDKRHGARPLDKSAIRRDQDRGNQLGVRL